MRKSLLVVGLVLGAGVLAWLAFGYFGIQALFTERVVNEEVPMVVGDQGVTPVASSTVSDVRVSTSTTARLLAQGVFQQGDNTYTIAGKVSITEGAEGPRLALQDFQVTNGPDLFVYLVSALEANNATVKEAVREQRFVNLGALKGNKGNQVYTLPADVKVDASSVVSIWCRRFARNFGAAPLQVLSDP